MHYLTKELLIVQESKITGYLLNILHPEGVNKALFFIQYGFIPSKWNVLQEALIVHASKYGYENEINTSFGKKYVIIGELISPDLRNPKIKSIWFKENNETNIKLVTAYPI